MMHLASGLAVPRRHPDVYAKWHLISFGLEHLLTVSHRKLDLPSWVAAGSPRAPSQAVVVPRPIFGWHRSSYIDAEC